MTQRLSVIIVELLRGIDHVTGWRRSIMMLSCFDHSTEINHVQSRRLSRVGLKIEVYPLCAKALPDDCLISQVQSCLIWSLFST